MPYPPARVDLVLLVAMLVCMTVEVWLFADLTHGVKVGTPRASRTPAYTYFIAYQWTLVAGIVVVWMADHRPWSVLLLGSPRPWGFAACLALSVLYIALAFRSRRALLQRATIPDSVRQRLASVGGLVPRTSRERGLWTVMALTAGVCEEIFFRGYLLSVGTSIVGLVGAVILTSLLFGLYHAYYGWKGIAQTGILGLILSVIALWSGSLIPGMIIHSTADLVSGDIGYQVASRPPTRPATETSS
jgi:uncharacterized protein